MCDRDTDSDSDSESVRFFCFFFFLCVCVYTHAQEGTIGGATIGGATTGGATTGEATTGEVTAAGAGENKTQHFVVPCEVRHSVGSSGDFTVYFSAWARQFCMIRGYEGLYRTV